MDSLGIFGKSFQENMCKLMLYDRSYCDQMQEVLDIIDEKENASSKNKKTKT